MSIQYELQTFLVHWVNLFYDSFQSSMVVELSVKQCSKARQMNIHFHLKSTFYKFKTF